MDITFDLADLGIPTASVGVAVSDNASATNSVAASSFTGDVGGDVIPGKQKRITWDAGTDWPDRHSTNIRFRVTAQVTSITPDGMALIPAGSFTMGDSIGEGDTDESPAHKVSLNAYYMDMKGVTKELWDDVYRWALSHGYNFDNAGFGKAPDHPVHTVNWHDAVKWSNARSEREGRPPAYSTNVGPSAVYRTGRADVQNDWVKWNKGYRLPTEAEWEKAARGGLSGSRFPWGGTITQHDANYLSDALYAYDTSTTRGYYPAWNDGIMPYTSPAGSFAPNGYGLYDMTGNVWAWCWDWYAYYSNDPLTDPRGPGSGLVRVLHGGAWNRKANQCRVTYRLASRFPSDADYGIGFRCVAPPTIPSVTLSASADASPAALKTRVQADLAVDLVSDTVGTNGSLHVTARVRSLGAFDVTNTVLSIRRCDAGGWTGNVVPLATAAVPALASGASAELVLDLPPGTQSQEDAFYQLRADETGLVIDIRPANDTVVFWATLASPPSISIDNVTAVNPASGGSTSVVFAVRLSRPSGQTIAVDYETANGTAIAGSDFIAAKGTLVFSAGETNKSIVVSLYSKAAPSVEKTFYVNLSNPVYAGLGTDRGAAKIVTDPPLSTVMLTSPPERSVFPVGFEMRITASVNAPGRVIRQVEYYVGDVMRGYSEYGPNYVVIWYGGIPVGNYSLIAKTVDSQGMSALSSPVLIAMSDNTNRAAIVMDPASAGADTLRSHLFEMGVSSSVFARGTSSYEALKSFDLVVWGQQAGANGDLTHADVDLARQIVDSGRPIYFMGESLIAAANKLDASHKSQWLDLLHIQGSGDPIQGSGVTIVAYAQAHPAIGGRFGAVKEFQYAGPLETVTAPPGAEVLGRFGTSDILVAYPKGEDAGIRSVTQGFMIQGGISEFSLRQRKTLFQNGVNWLLRGPVCGVYPLSVEVESPAGTLEAGLKATYVLRARQTGDCVATGVMVTNWLPSKVTFDSAQTSKGVFSYSGGKVIFDLGLLNNTETTEMKLVVIPMEAGAITNIASIWGNGSSWDRNNWATNIAVVQGSIKAVLNVSRSIPAKPELRLSGNPRSTYWIQESQDLLRWLDMTNAIHDGWSMPLPASPPSENPRRFYRAVTQ